MSRWLWLVKWLLALPHAVVLALLWIAFGVLSVVAFFAILITGRYPHAIFTFNLGVLRWTWRVAYYTYGALGTDRYPPFTLGEAPDYPASLDVAYPEHLSRGLVLVKWWLLALPHYLVLGFFLGSGGYAVYRAADAPASDAGWSIWGGDQPLSDQPSTGQPGPGQDGGGVAREPGAPPRVPGASPSGTGWSAGRVVTVVVGSLRTVTALGTAVGSGLLAAVDRGGRDADGFVTAGPMSVSSPGHAVVLDPVDLQTGPGDPDLGTTLGDVRLSATGSGGPAVFVGVGPAADVEAYLAGVERSHLTGAPGAGGPVTRAVPGGPPATPPAQQAFWAAATAGPGVQEVTWTATQGSWTAVVMNADGSRPVAAELTVGVDAPALRGLWTGLATGAAAALLAGALLVALAVPRRSRGRASGAVRG